MAKTGDLFATISVSSPKGLGNSGGHGCSDSLFTKYGDVNKKVQKRVKSSER